MAAAVAERDFRSRYLMKVGIAKKDSFSRDDDKADGGPTAAEVAATLQEPDAATVSVTVTVAKPQRPRATDDFRLAYIQRLTAARATIPQLNRPKSAQTVTIFDWDDTLMATTHIELVMQHFGGIPSSTKEQLKALEKVSCQLLTQACANGRAVIITNATEGWVQHSAGLCMPAVKELLETSGVQVISARGAYEQSFPGDCHAWKVHAFLQVQRTLNVEAVTNLISIGDSVIEMDAVHVIGSCFAHALVKTVKLWERPTPHELVKQLEVVAAKLPDIYASGTALNIWMERDQKTAAPGGGVQQPGDVEQAEAGSAVPPATEPGGEAEAASA
eukprot:CAMPEP_0206043942 /NCGR_PEP_ID=MMETSP1466-20131121/10875_1 /ASSEMBLY_ACC=CAM_ASM_001126 /TAXON_ID=44452 /ORGANISM="Pavlova gyrans, Strain CCMP608" /LENGTH=330 /DNA_ID=CAMNT_0053418809 /DNA_START=19 /DNA_END=1011 /DNA_ORIENTATION=+